MWLLKNVAGLVCLSFLLLSLFGCHQEGQSSSVTSDNPVVAEIQGEPIYLSELMAAAEQRAIYPSQRNLDGLLSTLIDQRAAVYQIEKSGLASNPEFLQLYRQLAYETLIKQLEQQEGADYSVSEKEIKTYYSENTHEFTQPARVSLSVIDFSTDHGDLLEARVEDVWTRIHSHQDFSLQLNEFRTSAAKFSDHRASRYRGGHIGYVEKGSRAWPESLVEAAFAAPELQFVKLQAESGHYYIAVVHEIQDEFTKPLESVEASIRQTLKAQKYQAVRRWAQTQLRQGLQIETNAELVASVTKPEQELDSTVSLPRLPK